jgi:hypothetical protein
MNEGDSSKVWKPLTVIAYKTFEVSTVVITLIVVLWVMIPYNIPHSNQRFGNTCCLQFEDILPYVKVI